nr:uncharacterized protein LOC116775002 [Danaus plexippus plexippus]
MLGKFNGGDTNIVFDIVTEDRQRGKEKEKSGKKDDCLILWSERSFRVSCARRCKDNYSRLVRPLLFACCLLKHSTSTTSKQDLPSPRQCYSALRKRAIEYLTMAGVEIMSRPLYSLNLGPSDFYLIPRTKDKNRDIIFPRPEDAVKSYENAMEETPKDERAHCFSHRRVARGIRRARLAAEGKAKRVATEGKARRVAAEGKARRVAAEGKARRVAAEGKARRVAAEGKARRVAAEGKARRVAAEGKARRVAAEGKARRVAAEGKARRVAAEGKARRVAAEGKARRVAAEGKARRVWLVSATAAGSLLDRGYAELRGSALRLRSGLLCCHARRPSAQPTSEDRISLDNWSRSWISLDNWSRSWISLDNWSRSWISLDNWSRSWISLDNWSRSWISLDNWSRSWISLDNWSRSWISLDKITGRRHGSVWI